MMNTMTQTDLLPLEDLVGDLFVDRHDELRLFWNWATSIPHRHRNSYALIGRRRTGKTAILVKLFNRLFYEQDTVLPVFITFAQYFDRKKPLSMLEVGDIYLSSYLMCFLAFRYRRPELLQLNMNMKKIRILAEQFNDPIVDKLIEDFFIAASSTHIGDPPAQMALNTPRAIARIHNIPTAVIVDEFQVLTDVYDPIQNLSHDLTDSFQRASETWWAPMLVSGSAVSLLVNQALGGMLSGRFKYCHLTPLTREYTHDLVFRLGEFTSTMVTEEFAEAMWQLTGGYPYSIDALMNTASPACQQFPSLDALNEAMTFELTHINGELYQHYQREFRKYSTDLNATQVTKNVMFYATKYPGEQIDMEQAAQEIGVTLEDVNVALQKLYHADVVSKMGWSMYYGPSDPMLQRYIAYHYRREIEHLAPQEAIKDWQREYKQLRGKLNNFMGEVAEMYVQTLMQAFDDRDVDGTLYFNHPGTVKLPRFESIERRGGVVKAGAPIEIDLSAEWTLRDEQSPGVWLVQVKFTQQPISQKEVRHFIEQTDTLIREKNYQTVMRWYFCKQGYTAEAVKILQEAGVLFSDRSGFNALSKLFGFFGLPE